MQYYSLKSLLSSKKINIPPLGSSESFYVSACKPSNFIDPRFTKIEFPCEKPSIILVSAVGASGKTTTANALSFDTKIPILDLAKHKPVGDNSFTGIITNSYDVIQMSNVFSGLANGSHGVIIDGIDEARSKTTEQGFNAFLDDIISRSKNSPTTSIVIFGRGETLLNTWLYISSNATNVGYIEIDSFDMDESRTYIDAHVDNDNMDDPLYIETRNIILDKLESAFSRSNKTKDAFLKFIGYPPVLDAISKLLKTEKNYFRLKQEIDNSIDGDINAGLLLKIGNYLLDRDRKEKALPNFINTLADKIGSEEGQKLKKYLYNREEQCARILAHALSIDLRLHMIEDLNYNQTYESSIEAWLPEHPFLDGKTLRNPVFSAIAVCYCMTSEKKDFNNLAIEYSRRHSFTYHTLYFCEKIAKDTLRNAEYFNILMQSCSDFLGLHANMEIDISGEAWNDCVSEETIANMTINIEFPDLDQKRKFTFTSICDSRRTHVFGPNLINCFILLPSKIRLLSHQTIKIFEDCHIYCKKIEFRSPELVINTTARKTSDQRIINKMVYIESKSAHGHIDSIISNGSDIYIQCKKHTLMYPLAKYAEHYSQPLLDKKLDEKYRRLRRILLEFRSHKRGGLAKIKDKIEHDRVLKNSLGRSVLQSLITAQILSSDSVLYYIDDNNLSKNLGITWLELRQHKTSPRLETFLRNI